MRALLCALLGVLLVGCGDGNGDKGDPNGGGGAPGSPSPTLPGGSFPTPTVGQPVGGGVLFVRANTGSDDNNGDSAGEALQSIGAALAALPALTSGHTVIVGPGVYNETQENIPSGTASVPVVLLADPSGESTGDPPGDVVVDGGARSSTSVFRTRGAQFVTIDGFVVKGASGANFAGIDVGGNSKNVTIRNCQIFSNRESADGIAIRDSDDILLFNNLVYSNDRRGVLIAGNGSGSRRVRLVNNTVAENGNRGIALGTSRTGSEAHLLYNIVQGNSGGNILVSALSIDTYGADLNLVFPLTAPAGYSPNDLPQDTDINEDTLFVSVSGNNFRLSQSDSGQGGTSPAVDVAESRNVPRDLAAEFAALAERTTASAGAPDTGRIDLGYHYRTGGIGPGPVAQSFYVRGEGSDDSAGLSPGDAFRNISTATAVAQPGDTIVVGPGGYSGGVTFPRSGTPEQPIVVLADPSGERTGDDPGSVFVDGGLRNAAFRLTGAQYIVLDGFTVIGTQVGAGIMVRSGSHNATIRNCQIEGNLDGIRVQDSDDVVLFNNLVFFNERRGVVIERSAGARVVNNTMAENGARGIAVGTGTLPAPGALLQNNIVQYNEGTNVEFNDESAETAILRFNLVFPPDYRPRSTNALPRPNDIDQPALFSDVSIADFRLWQLRAGQAENSPALDAGDPQTPEGLVADLAQRTTATDGSPDAGAVDLGFHYHPDE